MLCCSILSGLRSVFSAIPSPARDDTTGSTIRMFNHGGLKPSDTTVTTRSHPSLNNTFHDTILSRDTSAGPYFVVYTDRLTPGVLGPPAASQVKGFNVVALSFFLINGVADKAQEWAQLTSTERSSIKAQYEEAGIKLLVSAFGATESPTTNHADPVATANMMAAFVIQYDLDGIDVDYEDFQAINLGDGSGESWIINFTKQLRTQLPQGDYILTHSPVAPWFSPGTFRGGAYLKVHQTIGEIIDWYNVQFYNQGTSEYTTCDGLLTESSSLWPQSALFQISANGVDLNKLVIGKPAFPGDANNGYMQPTLLAGCLNQARAEGWSGGVMVWEYPDANAEWIQMARAQAFSE
ncbi:glycoside hydrolase family 18 protein [Ramaria rubella]|nr:glycoside hydrolase family 18 protein [Ramaria rubella]